MTKGTDLSDAFMNAIPEKFLHGLDPDGIRRIHDFYDFAMFLPVRYDTYRRAQNVERRHREAMTRLLGYRGWWFVAYWWFVSWRALSLGITVHLWKPCNIEFHMPFGFIRIGFTDKPEREGQYDAWLRRYIIYRYDRENADENSADL